MNNKQIARELLKVAKALIATEFPTKEALEAYLKEHPGADPSNHSVKQAPKSDGEDPRDFYDGTGMEDWMMKKLIDQKQKKAPAESKPSVEEVSSSVKSVLNDAGFEGANNIKFEDDWVNDTGDTVLDLGNTNIRPDELVKHLKSKGFDAVALSPDDDPHHQVAIKGVSLK